MRRLLPLLVVLSSVVACAPATLGGPCQKTCDCPNLGAPIRCPGEWGCNADKVCEYTCKGSCDPTGVYTCRGDEECVGTLCSERKACP